MAFFLSVTAFFTSVGLMMSSIILGLPWYESMLAFMASSGWCAAVVLQLTHAPD